MQPPTDLYHDALASRSAHRVQAWPPTAADSLALALRGLPVAARALMVGIHPDDEDSALLAALALRHGLRTVYLSLTRGEGGQNRLGPESGTALGILRTGELLAARRYDGAEQLLGPCIDFGYARGADDAFRFWGRDCVVGTVVQAIRAVQPDVLVSIWTGSTLDGHGHHQACGIATHEAFALAADPDAFPEQIEAGLAPWQARRLLVRVRDVARQREGDLHLDVGRWDALLGGSCFEIAMQGRSQHRSQNMGALQPKGTQYVTYRVAAGVPVPPGRATDFLADLPLRLDAWVQAFLDRERGPVLEAAETATRLLDQAWDTFHPQHPDTIAPLLLQALRALRRAAQLLRPPQQRPERWPGWHALHQRLEEQIHQVESVWLRACGIALDVLAHQAHVVAGETFEVEAELFVRGAAAPTLLALRIHPQPGWRAECLAGPECPMPLCTDSMVTARYLVTAPEDEETAVCTTLLPWLRLPSAGNLYRFPTPLPLLAPSAPPLLTLEALLQIDDLHIPIVAPLMYREADPGFGEVRQPVRVVPAVTLEVAPSLIVMPASAPYEPVATVLLRAQEAAQGRLVLRGLDHGGEERRELSQLSLAAMGPRTVQQELPVHLDFRGKRTYLLAWERFPAAPAATKAAAYHSAVQEIRYPHIEPGYLLTPAQLSVTVVGVAVAPDLTIGYIPGTGDAVPEALASLGLAVATIDETRLQFDTLEKFDTIIVGVRALETRPLVAAHRERLWQYTRSGGTIIVQYQKPREDGPGRFIPFADVSMPRPVPRVSQKNAAVRLLDPDDPLFAFPNRIGPEDFTGWVQERGLYFLATWPPQMIPLLESADHGEPPRRGGLLRARLGAGHYVYCAYALFRQLPAGVPGAYRLLANLVSLPHSHRAQRAPRIGQQP